MRNAMPTNTVRKYKDKCFFLRFFRILKIYRNKITILVTFRQIRREYYTHNVYVKISGRLNIGCAVNDIFIVSLRSPKKL